MSRTVLLVGCGNMGRAMLGGWMRSITGLRALVVEPSDDLRDQAAALGAEVFAAAADLPQGTAPDLTILAVKPQVMPQILPDYAALVGTTYVSIAAGTTIATLRAGLGANAPIIRCMPNTPAAIGKGMMVCCATAGVDADARSFCDTLLAASGDVAWIEDEALMDAVTAVSGSGPAYVFHLIETLGAAAVAVGLPPELAARMAAQTVMGAGLLAIESGIAPGTLREQVTSPGGTTAAALSVLMQGGRMQRMMSEAVEAARDRGRELGKA